MKIKFEIVIVLLIIVNNAIAQVPVTHIASKESSMQMWSDVDWYEIAGLSVDVNATNFNLKTGDLVMNVEYLRNPTYSNEYYTLDDKTVDVTEHVRRWKWFGGPPLPKRLDTVMVFSTVAVITATGEQIRLSFDFSKNGLEYIYMKVVPVKSRNLIENKQTILVNGKPYTFASVNNITDYIDIVLLLTPNDMSP